MSEPTGTPAARGALPHPTAERPAASPFTLVGAAAPVCVDGVCELPAEPARRADEAEPLV